MLFSNTDPSHLVDGLRILFSDEAEHVGILRSTQAGNLANLLFCEVPIPELSMLSSQLDLQGVTVATQQLH